MLPGVVSMHARVLEAHLVLLSTALLVSSEWRVNSRTTQESPTNELQPKQSLMTASWQSAGTNVQQHKVACLA